MRRYIIYLTVITLANSVKGQNTIHWDGAYQLQFSDFKSPTTEIGGAKINYLYSPAMMDFSYQMTNAEFMFTKHFNSMVNCTFNRSTAAIIASDSLEAIKLLNFARYEFDLTELYARKFRKRLFEEKKAFSDASFFKTVYDEIHNEYTLRHATASKTSEVGQDRMKLTELHEEVLKEIELLSDFCKSCKPAKKKKGG